MTGRIVEGLRRVFRDGYHDVELARRDGRTVLSIFSLDTLRGVEVGPCRSSDCPDPHHEGGHLHFTQFEARTPAGEAPRVTLFDRLAPEQLATRIGHAMVDLVELTDYEPEQLAKYAAALRMTALRLAELREEGGGKLDKRAAQDLLRRAAQAGSSAGREA